MPNKNVSETHPPPGMGPGAEWDALRVSKTHAQLAARGCVTNTVAECCKVGAECADHDADSQKVTRLRAKSLVTTLTTAEVAEHNIAEIRAKAKGML